MIGEQGVGHGAADRAALKWKLYLPRPGQRGRSARQEASMSLFLYNTDADSLSRKGRFPLLIKQGFAATSGPITFGEQLGKLSPTDTLLMYENSVGIVAVGIVSEYWDRLTHKPPKYYQPGDEGFSHEYRIGVNWDRNFTDAPITVEQIRTQIGYIPQGAVVRIVKWQGEMEDLVREHEAIQKSRNKTRRTKR